jgi:hypothetical protein
VLQVAAPLGFERSGFTISDGAVGGSSA